jgi:hypothetical protein
MSEVISELLRLMAVDGLGLDYKHVLRCRWCGVYLSSDRLSCAWPRFHKLDCFAVKFLGQDAGP